MREPSKASSEVHRAGADWKAVLLVGGMGTRLRSVVPFSPKPLASVGDRPFLSLLVRQLQASGVRHLVMCTGYLAEQIESAFGDGREWGVSIEYSRESEPLGTAGAVRLAQERVRGCENFLVLNGDSFLDLDLARLMRFHHEHAAIATMAVVRVEDAARYGTVRVDDAHRVCGFTEKTGANAPGLVNAGIYTFRRQIFDFIPAGPASLERDVFPRLLEAGIYAFEQRGMFIDIGTPEDYARAQQLCERLEQAALRNHPSGSSR